MTFADNFQYASSTSRRKPLAFLLVLAFACTAQRAGAFSGGFVLAPRFLFGVSPRHHLAGTPTLNIRSLGVHNKNVRIKSDATSTALQMAKAKLEKVAEDDDKVIAFCETEGINFIDCYADSHAIVDGVRYTVGSPCDYSVALCYFDKNDQLVPVELDDGLMDDIFPVAESIVEEEFGDELALQRTPQTLTLIGELEEDEDDEDEEDDEESGIVDSEEEVEILLSFEEQGREYHLVRLLDPVLLVGKDDPESKDKRILLTPEEADDVMPELEQLFLEYQEERDSMVF